MVIGVVGFLITLFACLNLVIPALLPNSRASVTMVAAAAISALAFWLMVRSTLFPDVDSGQHAAFLLRNLVISTVVAAVMLRYLYVQFKWHQQVKTEARARIQALQARIRPHFLFNSMNTIAALTRSEPAMAEAAIEDLSDLFRASLADAGSMIRLKEELEAAGCSIPFPQHDVHVHQVAAPDHLRSVTDSVGRCGARGHRGRIRPE